MKGYIYKCTFSDGKVYIGQTRRPVEVRYKEHLNPSTGQLNSGFWEAYQAYGEPELTILETVEAEDVTTLVDLLNSKETAYISLAKATDPQYGYNRKDIATAYNPDHAILEKEIARLSNQAEEEVSSLFDAIFQKISTGLQSSLTDDEKLVIRNCLLENNLFDSALRKVINPEDFSVNKNEDLFLLEEAIEFAVTVYMDECEEEIYGYVMENAESILMKGKRGKIIQQLDVDGQVLREFVTKEQICDAFNIIRIDNILHVLNGKQKTAYGFYWRYKPD